MEVALYIKPDFAPGSSIVYSRIELFADEKISITSAVQDISDVSKAKTDFSQSFTIPASKVNNRTFKHWYNSAVDGGFDQRKKYDGYIEIDTLPFREGGFALNSANYKNNALESYTITFYGKAKSIKDILKEDKVNSLDFTSLNHLYNPVQVAGRINAELDVAYPLFANDRLFNYNDASAEDITTNAGSILWNRLFPAVSLPTIFSKITDKYGITFEGSFLQSFEFSKLWMLFKNSETKQFDNGNRKVIFTSKDPLLTDKEVNLTNGEIGFEGTSGTKVRLFLRIITTDPNPYKVLIYKNGVLFNVTRTTTFSQNFIVLPTTFVYQVKNDVYTYAVEGVAGFTFTSELKYYTQKGLDPEVLRIATGTSQQVEGLIDIGSYAPDLKIIDLFNGLVKMFNLVIEPTNENTFKLIPLELYYNEGKFKDITTNVISDNITINKTSMYKSIDFKYQKSENILNTQFDNIFLPTRNYGYGDLSYEQIDSLETEVYTVDLPFENPIFERKTASDFLSVTFKKLDLTNYLPKPILIYDNGIQNVVPSIKLNNSDGSFGTLVKYRRFSNEFNNGGTYYTLNWGEEISAWTLNSESNGLYLRYYANYLSNIFDIKGRLLNVNCIFSPSELINLKLNDRIIVKNSAFTINKMVTDLTSGEVNLELLSDYRQGEILIEDTVVTPDIFRVSADAQEVQATVYLGTNASIVTTDPSAEWITYSNESSNTNNIVKTISISENLTGSQRIGYFNFTVYDQDSNETEYSIPIIQDGNFTIQGGFADFSNTNITNDNTTITYDNDGTTTT